MDQDYREAMKLSNQLCFPLYAAARNVTGLYTPCLKPLGLTYNRHCEAFLFPSLFEGLGLPVIEAMSHGKPVFSSMQTSLSEIAGEYAFAFDSFEPELMARTVSRHSSFSMDVCSPCHADK